MSGRAKLNKSESFHILIKEIILLYYLSINKYSLQNITKYNYLGRTSLMMASTNGRLDVARVLVENGALVDAIDRSGKLVYISMK